MDHTLHYSRTLHIQNAPIVFMAFLVHWESVASHLRTFHIIQTGQVGPIGFGYTPISIKF